MKIPLETKSWLLLSKLPFSQIKKVKELLGKVNSVEDVFFTPLEKLSDIPKIDREFIVEIRGKLSYNPDLEAEYKLIDKLGIKLVPFTSSFYPENLANIYDPPLVLYVRGKLKKEDNRAVAVVGTRRATSYGKIAARKLARELAQAGVTVVSGMARGIDTAAHEGALEAGGRTIAVLGLMLSIHLKTGLLCRK